MSRRSMTRRLVVAALFGTLGAAGLGIGSAAAAAPWRLEADLTGDAVPAGGDLDGAGFITTWLQDSLACQFIETDGIDEVTAVELRSGGAGEDGDLLVTLSPAPPSSAGPCVDADDAPKAAILDDPAAFHVLVRTASHPDGALRGQLRHSTTNSLYAVVEACPSGVRSLRDLPEPTEPGPSSSGCLPVIRSSATLPPGYRWAAPVPIVFDWAARLTTPSGAVLTEADFEPTPGADVDECDAVPKTCPYPPNSGEFIDPDLATLDVTSGPTTLAIRSAPPGYRFGFADVWGAPTIFADEGGDLSRRLPITAPATATVAFDSAGVDVVVVYVYFVPPDLPATTALEAVAAPGPGGPVATWALGVIGLAGLVAAVALVRRREEAPAGR